MTTLQDLSANSAVHARRPLRSISIGNAKKNNAPSNGHSGKTIWRCVTPMALLSHMLVGVVTFQLGLTIGMGRRTLKKDTTTTKKWSNHSIFPDSLSSLFTGASMIQRDSFIQEFDVGVPWNSPKPGATDVLLLYGSERSLPSDYFEKSQNKNKNARIPDESLIRASYDSATDATSNCHTVKVILTEPNSKHECVAIVPQWESFHVQHFLRIVPEKIKRKGIPHFDSDYPLRLVSRKDTLSGKSTAQIPMAYQTKRYWPLLIDYLQKLEVTLERLKPIAASVSHEKTVVVMVCNFGQSELLFNFVCSAQARGLDLSNVLLFATDIDTSKLAESLGIAVFDVKDAFGDMPTGAAKVYGDRTFQGMMFSKVYCVHLVNALGYDVLFQDVDVVWYRNPIEFFHNSESGDFDLYFQDGTPFHCTSIAFRPLTPTECLTLLSLHFLADRRWSTFHPIYSLLTKFRILLCSLQRSDSLFL
jgi:Nucleotide-diphospho-sugar transferase